MICFIGIGFSRVCNENAWLKSNQHTQEDRNRIIITFGRTPSNVNIFIHPNDCNRKLDIWFLTIRLFVWFPRSDFIIHPCQLELARVLLFLAMIEKFLQSDVHRNNRFSVSTASLPSTSIAHKRWASHENELRMKFKYSDNLSNLLIKTLTRELCGSFVGAQEAFKTFYSSFDPLCIHLLSLKYDNALHVRDRIVWGLRTHHCRRRRKSIYSNSEGTDLKVVKVDKRRVPQGIKQ